MAEKKEFFCQDAAVEGRQAITNAYCFDECDVPLRGFRSICPETIRGKITRGEVIRAFEESSEAAKLAVETYSDLLRRGGPKAAESEKSDLLQDVSEKEKETVEGGMLVLLFLHRAKRGK